MILAFDMILWTFAKEIRALMHAKENLFFFFFTLHDIVYTRTEQEQEEKEQKQNLPQNFFCSPEVWPS